VSIFDKAETSSPTVSIEAMYTILVDTKEHQEVATADIVREYPNADMTDFTMMKLTGGAVNILLKVDNSIVSLSQKKMVNQHYTCN
jgi:hypothetical protein